MRPALLLAAACLAAPSFGQPALAQPAPNPRAEAVRSRYDKAEHHVRMRDGVELYVSVYTPKDASPMRRYPIVMSRTPYSCAPYGPDAFRASIGPSRTMEDEGYIFVCNDVRGRYMSDGTYDNMRPFVPHDAGVSESRDTYDVIDWLVRNVPNTTGKVGVVGISYPGHYASASLPSAHPALVAASPQAPIADFWHDDFRHNGAFLLSYFVATNVFGYQKAERTGRAWYPMVNAGTPDGYRWYLENRLPQNADRFITGDNGFWRDLRDRPTYDAFWQARNLLPHLKDVGHTAVLTVGGLFDAEDLYGAWQTYAALERQSPNAPYNGIVMGPWSHGQWASGEVTQRVGPMAWGDSLSLRYQRDVEAPFFRRFLKGSGDAAPPEATIYDTGARAWRTFDRWPAPQATPLRLHLASGSRLGVGAAPSGGPRAMPNAGTAAYSQFVSDPNRPVPDMDKPWMGFTPRAYMAEDQRFAGRRPDVLGFETEPLAEDVTLAGPLTAHLNVSTTGTDADWIVSLIDVFPPDTPSDRAMPGVALGGYELMVRSEIMPARFRNGFTRAEPMRPGRVAAVRVPLQGVLHTFKRGHRIRVHVQSTMFPLFARNPQTFVANPMTAPESAFRAHTHRVYHSASAPSYLDVGRLR